MSKCANCGTTILFGGIKSGSLVFCNKNCYEQATILRAAMEIPEEDISETVREIHQGTCPVCGRDGPVDLHSSHRVMSFLVFTRFESIPRVSCQSCAAKAKIKDGLITFFVGWWGFPWGIALTPIYLVRNMWGLVFPVSTFEPSAQLKDRVRLMIGLRTLQESENSQRQNDEQ